MSPAPTFAAIRLFAFFGALLLAACNSPPLYQTRAQQFLEKKGVPQATITRLVQRQPLTAEEAARLEVFCEGAVGHLLASNPSIPPAMLLRLSLDSDVEVRWGTAYNPRTPVARLLGLRDAGKYSTMNEYLARNPALPVEVMTAMYRSGEASKLGFAMNPALPEELIRDIAASGDELARIWLAGNPSLSPELMTTLERDPIEGVRRSLEQNPAYKRWRQGNATTG
ncbi:MAG: hypothetical protein HZA63_04265 [Rhodocyclales bacterium]|nr:hypothetical protein [Rhodocyclales bacterium]